MACHATFQSAFISNKHVELQAKERQQSDQKRTNRCAYFEETRIIYYRHRFGNGEEEKLLLTNPLIGDHVAYLTYLPVMEDMYTCPPNGSY